MFKYLVIGAGDEGEAIAYDLLRHAEANGVTLLDVSKERLNEVAGRLNDPRLKTRPADVTDLTLMILIMKGHDVAVSAVPYNFNLGLAKAALLAGVHFVDLGGNPEIVAAEFALSDEAEELGLKLIPDVGIAPGAVSVLVVRGIEMFEEAGYGPPDSIYIHDGGLPQNPDACGDLQYALVFSVHGLINEYIGQCEILRDGHVQWVDGMTEIERVEFPEPYGVLESAHGSGGMSTLVKTYAGVLKNLEYKVLRYPGKNGMGHWQKMNALRDMGFFSETPLDPDDPETTARSLTEYILEKTLPRGQKDLMIARLIFRQGDERELWISLVDLFDDETGHTAMQRTTGYTAGIVARMLATGEIKGAGTLYQERAIPAKRFVEEWAKRGIEITMEWRPVKKKTRIGFATKKS